MAKKEKCPLKCGFKKHIVKTTIPFINSEGKKLSVVAYISDCCATIFLSDESKPLTFKVDEYE